MATMKHRRTASQYFIPPAGSGKWPYPNRGNDNRRSHRFAAYREIDAGCRWSLENIRKDLIQISLLNQGVGPCWEFDGESRDATIER